MYQSKMQTIRACITHSVAVYNKIKCGSRIQYYSIACPLPPWELVFIPIILWK